MKEKTVKTLFVVLCVIMLTPYLSGGIALITGVLFALVLGNPFAAKTKSYTPKLLQFSVVGLGAGMDLRVVSKVGYEGIGYTVIGITFAMGVGLLLGKLLKARKDTALLITVGTAICGGSAIAAAAPVIRAKDEDTSVALATVFLLNAVALLIFPFLGHYFHMEQRQFGLWSALAIHDTSSVVGASMQYGAEALQVATTVKLARALWIVPLTFLISFFYRDGGTVKTKKPWFILGFLLAAALVTWIPEIQGIGQIVAMWARRSLVLTLFLIGTGLSKAALKKVGTRPLIQGVVLWLIVGTATLVAILTSLLRV